MGGLDEGGRHPWGGLPRWTEPPGEEKRHQQWRRAGCACWPAQARLAWASTRCALGVYAGPLPTWRRTRKRPGAPEETGKKPDACCTWGPGFQHRDHIERQFPPDDVVRACYQDLCNRAQLAIGEQPEEWTPCPPHAKRPALNLLAQAGLFLREPPRNDSRDPEGELQWLSSTNSSLPTLHAAVLAWAARHARDPISFRPVSFAKTLSTPADGLDVTHILAQLDAMVLVEW